MSCKFKQDDKVLVKQNFSEPLFVIGTFKAFKMDYRIGEPVKVEQVALSDGKVYEPDELVPYTQEIHQMSKRVDGLEHELRMLRSQIENLPDSLRKTLESFRLKKNKKSKK